jgi:ABC-2 type transport system ATP-binding protein
MTHNQIHEPEKAIETEHLSRQYGRIAAVTDINLLVPSGSIYSFLGPNGAGKTTTIRMLLGLIRPHNGQIRIFGQSIHEQREQVLRQVGALVETPSLYSHLSGRENLEVTRRLLDVSGQRINEVLKLVDLVAAADRPVRGYSLGMRQRLALGLALLGTPRLLILDEPTNGLDPAGIHEIRHLIRRLVYEQGITVFLSSHLLSEVEQIATHIGIIRSGKLLFQGLLSELQERRREQVIVQVDRPEEALQVLEQAGWEASCGSDQQLVIAAQGQNDTARVNAVLAKRGFHIFHLSLKTPSLEDIFLNLTQDGEWRYTESGAKRSQTSYT